jgi:hypothetical protein
LLHAWISSNLMGMSAAVAKGSEDGYISGPFYRGAKTESELPLSGRDRQGWLGLSTWSEGMLRPRRIRGLTVWGVVDVVSISAREIDGDPLIPGCNATWIEPRFSGQVITNAAGRRIRKPVLKAESALRHLSC